MKAKKKKLAAKRRKAAAINNNGINRQSALAKKHQRYRKKRKSKHDINTKAKISGGEKENIVFSDVVNVLSGSEIRRKKRKKIRKHKLMAAASKRQHQRKLRTEEWGMAKSVMASIKHHRRANMANIIISMA